MYIVYKDGLYQYASRSLTWALRYIAKQMGKALIEVTISAASEAGWEVGHER